MSRCLTTFNMEVLRAYALVEQRCPDNDIYFLNPRDGRSWFISKVSEDHYAYVYIPAKLSTLKVVPVSTIAWKRMMNDSQLVTKPDGLPYAHRD